MRSGNELGWLGGILAGAVAIGALISPAINWGLTSLPEEMPVFGSKLRIPEYIAQKGHAAIFSRVVMVAAAIGFALFWRRLGITSPARLGLPRPGARHVRDIAAGVLIGIVSLAAMVFVKHAVGEVNWKFDSKSGGRIAAAVLTGGLVGLFEEIVFHGLIFGGLYRRMGMAPAFLITNAVYSVSHSLNAIKGEAKANIVVSGPLDVSASLQCLNEFIGGASAEPVMTAMKFLSLFLFGLLLTYAVVGRHTVYLAMGLHAGVVFFLQADGAVRELNDAYDHAAAPWLLGGKHIESSVAGQAAMLIGLGLTWMWLRQRPTPPADADETEFLPARRDSGVPAEPADAPSERGRAAWPTAPSKEVV